MGPVVYKRDYPKVIKKNWRVSVDFLFQNQFQKHFHTVYSFRLVENRQMKKKFRNFTNFMMQHYFRNGRNPDWLNSKLFSCEVLWLILDQHEAGVFGIRYCIFHLINN